jgi:hypothetical protein
MKKFALPVLAVLALAACDSTPKDDTATDAATDTTMTEPMPADTAMATDPMATDTGAATDTMTTPPATATDTATPTPSSSATPM